MGGVTPSRGYPFPIAGEQPAGHTQIQDLAVALDGDIAASVVKKADLGIGLCSMTFSAGWAVPSKGSIWHQLPFDRAAGSRSEWANTATGRIVIPAAGVYSLQFTGAVQNGAGLITCDVSNAAPGLFLQESSHPTDLGQPFVVSISNLWECAAGAEIRTYVMVQQHTQANPGIWGTMVVARVEG